MNGRIDCNSYKECKTIEYLNRLGNTIYKEREELEEQ
jgi:hypothetical protein